MTAAFTAGSVLTAANLNSAINTDTINAQTGAGYTLVLTDAGKLVTLSNASAQNLTIPLNASVAYATGTWIDVLNIGAGTWTVTATGGVTLAGTVTVPQYGRVRLTKTGTNTWYSSASDAAVGGGLSLITTATFTTSAAVNVNSCFSSSSYENYQVVFRAVGSSASYVALAFRLRASGVDAATNYNWAATDITATSGPTRNAATAATSFTVGYAGDAAASFTLNLFRPAVAASTHLLTSAVGWGATTNNSTSGYGYHSTATSYDGFSVTPGAGTVTGQFWVFGYRVS